VSFLGVPQLYLPEILTYVIRHIVIGYAVPLLFELAKAPGNPAVENKTIRRGRYESPLYRAGLYALDKVVNGKVYLLQGHGVLFPKGFPVGRTFYAGKAVEDIGVLLPPLNKM
jgi:hypothetical protein